mgnify:FL=1
MVYATLSVVVESCKKEPGSGGNSSIKGNLWQKDCGSGFDNTTPVEHSGADLDIYIIYGNDVSYSDRIRTDYEGDFEFKYLRKGNYKIYFYSMDSTLLTGAPFNTIPPEIAIVKEVEITKRKQTIDVARMTTFKAK